MNNLLSFPFGELLVEGAYTDITREFLEVYGSLLGMFYSYLVLKGYLAVFAKALRSFCTLSKISRLVNFRFALICMCAKVFG